MRCALLSGMSIVSRTTARAGASNGGMLRDADGDAVVRGYDPKRLWTARPWLDYR